MVIPFSLEGQEFCFALYFEMSPRNPEPPREGPACLNLMVSCRQLKGLIKAKAGPRETHTNGQCLSRVHEWESLQHGVLEA